MTDVLESIEIIEVKKNENRKTNYVNLEAKVNIYYKTIKEYLDYSDFLYHLRLRIQEKYKITIIFLVEDEVNNQVREW
jgi:hypothetical protein